MNNKFFKLKGHNSQILGRHAEAYARTYLEQLGFVCLLQNYRFKRAEIDLIVRKDKLLVFVEVKARSRLSFGYPEQFVNARQRMLLLEACSHYLASIDWHYAIRFDIIAFERYQNQWKLTHFQDAIT